jgi:UDP-N-acetylenolpyruvoylglucosamine reductase
MKKIHVLAEKELNEIVSKQEDFSNLDEVNFYREKFKAILNLFNESIHQGYKKSRVQTETKIILQDNFVLPGSKLKEDLKEEPINKTPQTSSNKLLSNPEPKSTIASFFDAKKTEIQKSRMGFKSILEGLPQVRRQ